MCQTTAHEALSLTLRSNFGAEPRDRPCRLDGIVREAAKLSPDVSMFQVDLDAPMPCQAGQFVIVSFEGLTGPRAYSMSSFAAESSALSLLIRRCGAGGASERLFSGQAAHRVQVFGPLGKAVFDPAEGRPFVAIAGGPGIAGVLAILDCAAGAPLRAVAVASLLRLARARTRLLPRRSERRGGKERWPSRCHNRLLRGRGDAGPGGRIPLPKASLA